MNILARKALSSRRIVPRVHFSDVSTRKSIVPPFNELNFDDIHLRTKFAIQKQITSTVRWTPLLQKQDALVADDAFQRKMRYFKNLRFFKEEHQRELTDAILYQALKDTDFDYYYDYKAKASPKNEYHGVIDFLIYNKKNEKHLPLIPVVMTKHLYMKSFGFSEDVFNVAQAIGTGLWTLSNMRAADGDQSQQVHVLHTNGSQWRLYRICSNGDFEKTGIYVPNDKFKKIYKDQEAQSVAMGLVRFALAQPTENEKVLKQVYDFVDERRYMTEIDPAERDAAERSKNRFWWFLPKKVRDFLFKYN